MGWIDLAEDRGHVAASCECGNERQVLVKFGEFLD